MNMNFELLRRDLMVYTETALSVGLPHAAESVEEVQNADEERLVSLAADQGWDFGKYVES